jgi:regulator of protease activity HflC (stomatin/prohibitin superfamily)
MVTAHDCGLEIINVGLNRIYPPANTKAAFEEVTAADNASAAMIKEAETYAEIQKNDAAAKSVAIKAAAEIYKKRVIAKLNAQMAYFENIRKQNNNGALVMALYTDMLREIAPGISSDKFVLGPQGQGKTLWLKLNPEPKTSAAANGAEEGK